MTDTTTIVLCYAIPLGTLAAMVLFAAIWFGKSDRTEQPLIRRGANRSGIPSEWLDITIHGTVGHRTYRTASGGIVNVCNGRSPMDTQVTSLSQEGGISYIMRGDTPEGK